MAKESGIQVHEANRTPNYLGAKKTFCKTHYIKIIKVNNKEFLKQPGVNKTITYKAYPHQ